MGILGILYFAIAGFFALSGLFLIMGGAAIPSVPSVGGAKLEMKDYVLVMGIDYLVTAAVAILLFVGTIALFTRRPWAGRCWLMWAALKIIVVLVFSTLSTMAMQKSMQATVAAERAANPGGMPPPGVIGAASIAPALVYAVLGLILPAIVLIWFLQPSIKAQIRGWGDLKKNDGPEHGDTIVLGRAPVEVATLARR